MLPNIPTRTERKQKNEVDVVQMLTLWWFYSFKSSFPFYCMLPSKNKNQAGRPPYPYNSTHVSLAGAQGPLPWPQLEPLQENYKGRNFPSLLAPARIPAGRAGLEGRGFPEDLMRISTVPTREGNWFRTIVALSFLVFLNAHCGGPTLKFCFTMIGYDPGINFLYPVSQASLLHRQTWEYLHHGVDIKNSGYKFFRS